MYDDTTEWACVYLLLNVNSAIFQLYHGDNKLNCNSMMMRSSLYKTITLSWIYIVLIHGNKSPRIDMSLHSDTLAWFRANHSLFFLLNAWYSWNISELTLSYISLTIQWGRYILWFMSTARDTKSGVLVS
jgi:hypothetical protein